MKTRKYKDNQQRKNFAKNESNILLIQYFKKVSGVNVSSELGSVATRSDAFGIRPGSVATQFT